LEFIKAFYGCLLAGVVAVPAIPPSSRRSLERILAIMDNAGTSAILSHTRALNRFESGLITDKKIILINVDNLKNKNAFTSPDDINENTIALLQYTSGSTGNPKGVIITHKNLLSNVECIKQAFCQDKNSIILNWLPLYHDMGLVGSVLFPLYLGVRSILISPVQFAENPIRWLKAISKYKVTTSGGPNFGYDHCVRSIREIDKQNLDLSSWKVAFIGAEPIRNKTLIDFDKTFSPFGFNKSAFQPCYGMAEATLLISANPFQSGFRVETHDGDKPILSCGKPVGA
jgi:acyl-CoA synthetase (AMP-forming)/AMP-acid ligase II